LVEKGKWMRGFSVEGSVRARNQGHRGQLSSGTMMCIPNLASGKCLRVFWDIKADRWEGKVMNDHEEHLNRFFPGQWKMLNIFECTSQETEKYSNGWS
jgi:hypothetical protein